MYSQPMRLYSKVIKVRLSMLLYSMVYECDAQVHIDDANDALVLNGDVEGAYVLIEDAYDALVRHSD